VKLTGRMPGTNLKRWKMEETIPKHKVLFDIDGTPCIVLEDEFPRLILSPFDYFLNKFIVDEENANEK